jgi:hypothetical protein
MRHRFFLCLILFFSLPYPALACSLCGSLGSKLSLVQEFDSAQAALYGYIANSKLEGASGGTTEFHIEKIIKNHADLPKQKMMVLHQWLPILDPKNPPRYLMFFSSAKNKLEPYIGKSLHSASMIDFLVEHQKLRDDPKQALLFAAKHFDHADPLVAEEAFLSFAKADDRHIGQIAKKLSPEKLRKLLQTPKLESERFSMFAFLLGACGNAEDADYLRSLLKSPNERNFKSIEGILAGYITMKPQEGWSMALDILKNEKNSLLLRYATLRTMRFFHNAKAEQFTPQILQGMGLALNQYDIADVAIQDLRKWKRWEHTKVILASYDKKSHQSPIVQNHIIRYALVCPLPEARALVERVRRQDPELVADLEEQMMLDTKK